MSVFACLGERFKRDKTGIALLPENDNYQPIRMAQGQTLGIAGVVPVFIDLSFDLLPNLGHKSCKLKKVFL